MIISYRSVSGNDYGFIRDHAQVAFGCTDHSIDTSTGGVINKRIDTIPECISDVNHVRLFKDHRDIAIRVGRAVILQRNTRVVVMQMVFLIKYDRGKCSGW